MKILGVYNRCQNTTGWIYRGRIEIYHVYVQKHIAPLEICSNPPPVRGKPPGAPAFLRLAYFEDLFLYV